MDIPGQLNSMISFAQNNTAVAVIVAIFLLFFVYRKPKLFFGLLFLALFLAGLFYMIDTMARSSSEKKQKLLPGDEKVSYLGGSANPLRPVPNNTLSA